MRVMRSQLDEFVLTKWKPLMMPGFFAKHDVTSGSEWNCCWQEQICKSWEISAPMSTMALTGVVRWQNNELKWHSLFTRFVCFSINTAHSTIDAEATQTGVASSAKKAKEPEILRFGNLWDYGGGGVKHENHDGREKQIAYFWWGLLNHHVTWPWSYFRTRAMLLVVVVFEIEASWGGS